MLREFGPDIWISDGANITAMAGFHYPTRMAVIRLENGGLVIWSPIALTADLQHAIAGLGSVSILIAPNKLHDSFLADWAAAYPDAQIFTAPGMERAFPNLDVNGPDAENWPDEIDRVLIPNKIADEIVLFHHGSGTVIFTDILQQMPRDWYSGWRRLVARLDLMCGAEPQVPRKFRMAMGRGTDVNTAMGKVISWPIQKVLMAHGTPVQTDAGAFLKRAFLWLKP